MWSPRPVASWPVRHIADRLRNANAQSVTWSPKSVTWWPAVMRPPNIASRDGPAHHPLMVLAGGLDERPEDPEV